jgi:hypothetical protein
MMSLLQVLVLGRHLGFRHLSHSASEKTLFASNVDIERVMSSMERSNGALATDESLPFLSTCTFPLNCHSMF